MPETKEDKWILTYERYHKYKGAFEQKDFNDGLNPNRLLDHEKFNNSDRRIFRTVLKELLRHLRNHGTFMTYEEEACRYISYILSKDVQSIVHEYKPETFVMFQEFVNTYNNTPTLTKYKSTNCSRTLVHVHSEVYKKMHKLYVLYDAYKTLIAENKFDNKQSCSAVHGFLHEYNEFIRENQPTNDHFKYILKQFEKEIDRNVQTYRRYTCENDRFYLQEIILQKDEKPKKLVQIDQQRINAEYEEVNHFNKHYHTVHNMSYNKKYKDLHVKKNIIICRTLSTYICTTIIKRSRRYLINSNGILQLDPSLEEEEDDSVKFLELLEDFHQEISDIFRNMVVGMLDIVKWICLFRGNSSCCIISS
ncbi:hypothetical protein PVIIG_05641 [Plasmodium vivax India VII]|uniref:Uncharacterized protein n=1 Tax=Plasmodium vivax India VII TaxID=1077284 RepID=A0A0J9S331_PLAVI|nr:hypothetical protein PVIIG_05641 [Plasmodium vivax India VII]